MKKLASAEDGRITYLTVTEAGKAFQRSTTNSTLLFYPVM